MQNHFIWGGPAGLTSKFGPSSWIPSALNFRYGIPLGKRGFAQSQQVFVVTCTYSVDHEHVTLVLVDIV